MEMKDKYEAFTELLVQRGLGLYGRDRMAKICYESDVGLLDDDTISFLSDDKRAAMEKLIINYAKFNLVAKMTVMALAKQYEIEIPEEVKKKRGKKSRFARFFRR